MFDEVFKKYFFVIIQHWCWNGKHYYGANVYSRDEFTENGAIDCISTSFISEEDYYILLSYGKEYYWNGDIINDTDHHIFYKGGNENETN